VTPRSYLSAALHYWIFILAMAVVGVGTGVAVGYATTKTYEASAQVLFSAKVTTNGQDLAYAGSYVQGRMATYRKLGESPAVLKVVADSLNTGVTSKKLIEKTDVESVPGTTIIKVTATDHSKARAIRMADALAGAIRIGVERLENAQKVTKTRPVIIAGVPIGNGARDVSVLAPNFPFNVLVGGLVGLVVGYAVASVREAFRKRD